MKKNNTKDDRKVKMNSDALKSAPMATWQDPSSPKSGYWQHRSCRCLLISVQNSVTEGPLIPLTFSFTEMIQVP